MKYLFFFALFSLASSNLFCQTDNALMDTMDSDYLHSSELVRTEPESIATIYDNETLYQRKVISYTKMKKAGITLLVTGGASVLVGSIMTASADWESYSSSNSAGVTTNDPLGGAGMLVLGIGIPVTVVGIIFTAIGAKKVKYYGGKLDNLSLNISTSNEHCGLILTYKF